MSKAPSVLEPCYDESMNFFTGDQGLARFQIFGSSALEKMTKRKLKFKKTTPAAAQARDLGALLAKVYNIASALKLKNRDIKIESNLTKSS